MSATFDWEYEAQRVAAAFGVAEFNKTETGCNRVDYQSIRHKILIWWSLLENGELDYVCIDSDCDVWRNTDGTYVFYQKPLGSEHSMEMAKAFVCLGLDATPIENTTNLTITTHERLEWMLEMKRAGFEVPKCN